MQVIDYYTGRPLSDWHTARAYLDIKKPPFLNLPEQDAQVALRDPLFIRFQWTPRHQGLSGTEYEFVLKELPDNGVAPQSAFAYGQEIYRTHTRSTSLSYTHLDPLLLPNRRYAWQVRALAREGMNEVRMFEHGGYSEISWFTLNDQCDAPRGLKAQPRLPRLTSLGLKLSARQAISLNAVPRPSSMSMNGHRQKLLESSSPLPCSSRVGRMSGESARDALVIAPFSPRCASSPSASTMRTC